MGREDEIRLLAYNIWEEEGCFDGHDCEHWFRAETVWEQQQKERAAVQSAKTESKQAVTQNKKVIEKGKKPKKT